MSRGPASDDEVRSFWQGLGLPGILDVHVHFMPDNVQRKVWAYFDAVGPVPWPIVYREDQQRRLERLRAMGVLAFPSLLYPHKADMAEWLNDWARQFAGRHGDVLPTATFYPEPSAARYVADALVAGARMFKSHVQVGEYDPRDPLLDPVWGQLADAGVPVVVHCGNGPVPGPFTGPENFAEVLRRHPRLVALIAHMGMPDYDAFFDIARAYPRVHLDTTMAFTDFSEATMPFPPASRAALVELADRVVLGTDFPNTPHTYSHQLEALARLDLGDDWLRGVLHDNAARLLAFPLTC